MLFKKKNNEWLTAYQCMLESKKYRDVEVAYSDKELSLIRKIESDIKNCCKKGLFNLKYDGIIINNNINVDNIKNHFEVRGFELGDGYAIVERGLTRLYLQIYWNSKY